MKLNSPSDVLKYMRNNDQFSFLPNFGKVVGILDIISATSCSAEQSFSVLWELKTYLRGTMELDCISHLALLRTECAYSNRVFTEKVIDEFDSRKVRSKFFL